MEQSEIESNIANKNAIFPYDPNVLIISNIGKTSKNCIPLEFVYVRCDRAICLSTEDMILKYGAITYKSFASAIYPSTFKLSTVILLL